MVALLFRQDTHSCSWMLLKGIKKNSGCYQAAGKDVGYVGREREREGYEMEYEKQRER